MFGFIKNALTKIYDQFTSKIQSIFSKSRIDQEALGELEKILISADTGIHTTRQLLAKISKEEIKSGQDLKTCVTTYLSSLLEAKTYTPGAEVYLLVGINGSGKTTCAAKLGLWFKNQDKKVLYVAADTFRAAATEQLKSWADRLAIDIIIGKEGQDPASVVFAGCQAFKDKSYDILIIDTAGRLQTKVNLMKELEKIKKTIEKQLPDKKISTLLTVDSMLGQNSFEQAKLFNESTNLDGVILTKMDGTGKGGIIFSISQTLGIPTAFISFGEQPDQFALFNGKEFIKDLLG